MASTVTSSGPRFSTVSIMPGMEARAPERTETRSWVAGIAKTRAGQRADMAQSGIDLCGKVQRIAAINLIECRANLVEIVEARWHGKPEIAHLRQIGAFCRRGGS